MNAELIDGKAIAAGIREELKQRVEALAARNVTPGLAVILAGDDPASLSYVTAKENDCAKVGIASRDIRLPADVNAAELLRLIAELNTDLAIHGILVQLPLPAHIDEEAIINAIDPAKDVDGFHPVNMGKLVLGVGGFIPCTPHGVIKMLEHCRGNHCRVRCGCGGPQPHCGCSAGQPFVPKGGGRECHGNGLPYTHGGSGRKGTPGGYCHCSRRTAQHGYG